MDAFAVLMKPREAPRDEDQDLLACRICRCSKVLHLAYCWPRGVRVLCRGALLVRTPPPRTTIGPCA